MIVFRRFFLVKWGGPGTVAVGERLVGGWERPRVLGGLREQRL